MTNRKRKTLFWLFKIAGILISCALPIIAVCEKFPIWTAVHGTGRSIGVGGILITIVLVIIFRRTVFKFLEDTLKLKHAPPLVIWLVMLICSYVLLYINKFIEDMTTVFWMGLVGCAIGTILTMISNRFSNKGGGTT